MITTITLSLLLHLFATATAHQSIAAPVPISYVRDCRVGNGRNCPGPCPRTFLRTHIGPDNPQATVRRGGYLGVKTMKNNHVGGFVRWSLVKVKDMHSHAKHRQNAFYYSCADQGLTKCNRRNRRDYCPGDRSNEFYQHYIRIPQIFDDGVYVLGFAWYGGLTSQKKHGFFGDYYDCTYIRIRGGSIRGSHQVTFRQGNSVTGRGGMCKATTDRLGPCRREPCKGNGPLGYRVGYFTKPAEFSGKRRPKSLTRRRSGGTRGNNRNRRK